MSEAEQTGVMREVPRELTDKEREQVKVIKGMGERFHQYLDSCTPGREMSIAKTKLEEVVMWGVKGITG